MRLLENQQWAKINRFYLTENDRWVSDSNDRPMPIMFWLVRSIGIENTLERYIYIYFSLLKSSKTINSLHLRGLEVDFIHSNQMIRSLVYYCQNLQMAGRLN
jgi:hypothetical protein